MAIKNKVVKAVEAIQDRFAEFVEMRAKYNTEIEKVRQELKAAQSHEKELTEKLNDLIGNLASHDEVTPIEEELAKVEKKISQLKRNIGLLSTGKQQKLAGLVPVLKTYKEQRQAAILEEYRQAEHEVHRKRAELLLAVNTAGRIHSKAERLHSEYMALKEDAGDDERDFLQFPTIKVSLDPNYFGAESAGSASFAVPGWLIRDAISGRYPKWFYKIQQSENPPVQKENA